MSRSPALLLALTLSCASARPASPGGAAPGPAQLSALELPPTHWDPEKQAVHVLNRLAYGPSPSDLAEVERVGAAAWIARQLHPESISEDALERKLANFRTLSMSTPQLVTDYVPLGEKAKEAGLSLKDPSARAELREMLGMDDLPRQIGVELAAAKLIRAVEAQRQLEEVLVDFWFNHFNVSFDKGACRWMLTSYERDAIRPHVFGKFRDLLGATAHHPAMLFYLDNWTSRANGLNENYARELLELHTLGVDGGYTQQDVREVARAFTGWSIDRPRKVGVFAYHPGQHDKGTKEILGVAFPAGHGQDDGERVLDLIAEHPSTARFIATKLCRKFVSDNPPSALVARIADVFQKTHGDLRAVYEALFTSPEFWSDEAFAEKVKTPLELTASAVRVLGGMTTGDFKLVQRIAQMGEPLYRSQPPTGYPEIAEPWVNAGALVNRINFGLALASGRVPGAYVDVGRFIPPGMQDPDTLIDYLAKEILHAQVAVATRETIHGALAAREEDQLPDGEKRPVDPRIVAGLLLGSPQFQKQ